MWCVRLSAIRLQFISCPQPLWWSRLLMDAAILIVIVDSGCKFHGGVIWPPQRRFSLHAPPRRPVGLSHPMNSATAPRLI